VRFATNMTQMSDDDWEPAGHNVPAEEFGSALADFDLIAPSPDRFRRYKSSAQ